MAQDDVKHAYKPNLFSLLYKLRASGYKLRLLSFRSSLEEEYLIYFLLRKLHLIKGAVLLVIFFCLAAILGAWPFYEPPMSVKLMQLAVLSCIVAVYFILRTYTFYHHHKYIAHLVYLGFSVLIFFLLCVRSGDLQIAMIAFYFGYVMVVVALPAIGQVQFVALVNISISFIVASIYTGIYQSTMYGPLAAGFTLCTCLAVVSCVHSDIERRFMFMNERDLVADKSWSDRLLGCLIPKRMAEKILADNGTQDLIVESNSQSIVIFVSYEGLHGYFNQLSFEVVAKILNRLDTVVERAFSGVSFDYKKESNFDQIVILNLDDDIIERRDLIMRCTNLNNALRDLIAEHQLMFGFVIYIHSGQVNSCISGTHRFSYDVWGAAIQDVRTRSISCSKNSLHESNEFKDLVF